MSVNDSNYNIWFPCVEGAWQVSKILRKKIPYICLLILNVTPANKYSMPYLTKKIAQLMKHLFLTSISSCCLQFSSLSLPAMFVDLIMLEWSACRQRPEQKNCMQKIYNLCVWHRHEYQEDPNYKKIPNVKKNPLSAPFAELSKTNYSFKIITILYS